MGIWPVLGGQALRTIMSRMLFAYLMQNTPPSKTASLGAEKQHSLAARAQLLLPGIWPEGRFWKP